MLFRSNPVLFFEHKGLYNEIGNIGDEDTFLPIGKAFVKGKGSELLVIGYSHAFRTAVKGTRDLASRITYIDLGTVSPLDEKTILREARRIGKVMIVQDTPLGGSVGDTVASLIAQKAFDSLKAPVKIVHAGQIPVPFSKILEQSQIPTEERVHEEALLMLAL